MNLMNTYSPRDLVNQALRNLGEQPVLAWPDATNPRALLALQFYDQVRDTLLTEHAWAFATIRTDLRPETTPDATLTPAAATGTGVLFTATGAFPDVFTAVGQTLAGVTPVPGTATVTALDIVYPPTTLTPGPGSDFVGATLVPFTAGAATFAAGDLHALIDRVDGTGRAQIQVVSSPTVVLARIDVGFDTLDPMTSGDWRVVSTTRATADIGTAFSGAPLTPGTWTIAEPAPPWGFLYRVRLPSAYLALQRTEDSGIFQREGDWFLTNERPLAITYTARVVDVPRWPPYFVAAVVAQLTATFATQITGQLEQHKIWLEIAQQRLKIAIELNDREGSPIPAQGFFAAGVGRDLVNQALRPLGPLPVQSRYLLADQYFAQIAERLLCEHFWNFATARVVLEPDPLVTPAWGYGHAFLLPTDYLAIQRVSTGLYYQREGNYLLSDELTLPLTYTKRVSDPAQWPRYFAAVFVAQLTAELAAQQPDQQKNVGGYLQIAEALLKRAKMHDGQEGSSPQIQTPALLRARRGAWGGWWRP